MKINKNSWHWKLVVGISDNFWDCDEKVNLCPYIRALVGALLLCGFVAMIACALVFLYLLPLLQIWVDASDMVLAVALLYVGTGYALIHDNSLNDLVKKTRFGDVLTHNVIPVREKKVKQSSSFVLLIREYLHAGHDKICPEIEVVDE